MGVFDMLLLILSIFVTAVKGCDQVLVGDNGTISSPGWPMPYPLNIECTYDIIVTEGNRVRIEFVNMSVETSLECEYDSVKIYDKNTSAILDTLCGQYSGQVYVSSANFMTIVFKSDEVQTDDGFVAVFSVVEGFCDKYLTSENGTFTSPNWPDIYPTNIVCQYSIVVPEEYRIKLQINDMFIEPHLTCVYDSIEITDGNQSLGIFCGQSNLEPFYSSTNKLSVTFISDSLASFPGFFAEYKAVIEVSVNNHTSGNTDQGDPNLDVMIPSQDECLDQVFEGLSGTVTSQNYPENYPLNSKCSYGIVVPVGMIIKLTFTEFEVEMETNCNYDSVTIHDTDVIYGTYCGMIVPSSIYTKQNSAKIILISDGHVTRKGFSLEFLAVAATTTVTTTTTTNAPIDLTSMGNTSDLMTIMLVTIGVVLAVSIFAVVSGLLFCKYTKNNVKNLKKSKKKRRVIAVKELPPWSTKNVMPPLTTQMNANVKPQENKIDLAIVDA